MAPSPRPLRPPKRPSRQRPHVLYRFEIRDLSLPGVTKFLASTEAASILAEATSTVLEHLYPATDDASLQNWPGTRSVTLILEEFSGVAFTTGLQLDDDHKEIHLSTKYVETIAKARLADEVRGVLVHEMVHAWQHNALGSAPGGLIEGVADWARLRAGLAPPHWKRTSQGDWDAGYDKTAFFLDFLEHSYGFGTVPRLNESLRQERYHEDTFWPALFGVGIDKLWSDYGQYLDSEEQSQAG